MNRLEFGSRFAKPLIALTITLLAGACSLGPQEDPTRFYLLSGPDDAPPAGIPVDRPERINVGIGPFTIPGYLDRAQFVRRIGPNEVNPIESARWAESLDEGFERVLAASLDYRLPAVDVYSHPWRATMLTQWIVTGDVHRFETDGSGTATLDVTWRFLDPDRQPTDIGMRSVVTTTSAGSQVDAEVAALSVAVDQFAELLAEVLREAGPELLKNR